MMIEAFLLGVFPARAGMNRARTPLWPNVWSVPRASGDEPPRDPYFDGPRRCSPRERG